MKRLELFHDVPNSKIRYENMHMVGDNSKQDIEDYKEIVCDYLALVRIGENKGAYCMANAGNQERYDFVKQYPSDNGFVLNTLKRQGYEKD